MDNLKGKVILITGAAKGMGAAEAKMATERGATVIVTDVLDERGKETANSIDSAYYHLDVSNQENWQSVVHTVMDEYGHLDGLVNNAGIFIQKNIFEDAQEAFVAMMRVNQLGTYLGLSLIHI